MARGLYRVYLYVVTIALAVAATVTLGLLLGAILGRTPLRGSNNLTLGHDVIQAAAQFGVTALIVAALGGLHYWLIRRDAAGDPRVNESGVRAFTLNLAEGIAILAAFNIGVFAIAQMGSFYSPDVAGSIGAALAAAALALALEWERRRATPTRGAALVFQRLRRHGVPLILLTTTLPNLYGAVDTTQRVIAQQANILGCSPPNSSGGQFLPTCVGNEIFGAWVAAILAIAVWLGLLWLGRSDSRSLIRQIFLLLGWTGGGMVLLAITLERAAEYVLRLLTPGADKPSYLDTFNGSQAFDFGPLFVVAAVALAVYGWALRERDPDAPMRAPTVRLTMRALAGATLAVPFWAGAFQLVDNAIKAVAPATARPVANDWDTAVAFVIAGLGYIPLAFWLGAGSRAEGVKGPRRGFVLALLAAGALVTAGAAATLLYSVITPLLGVPLDNWQDVARHAGAALIVGVAIGLLYLLIAVRERQFIPAPEAPRAAPAPAVSLDEVLTQFKGGDLSRDDAAERIRALAREGALT